MTAAVAIIRTELGVAGLRAAAARRMLALVLEGRSRTETARSAGMDRQTLRSNARV